MRTSPSERREALHHRGLGLSAKHFPTTSAGTTREENVGGGNPSVRPWELGGRGWHARGDRLRVRPPSSRGAGVRAPGNHRRRHLAPALVAP